MNECLFFSLLLVVGVSSVAGQCPTWFRETENGSCECGPDLEDAIKCNNCSKEVSLVLSYCMTYDNSSGELLVGYANYGFRGGRDRTYNSLPKNVAISDVQTSAGKGSCVGSVWVQQVWQSILCSVSVLSVMHCVLLACTLSLSLYPSHYSS